MLISIIRGNYGYNDGRIVRAKSPSDPPFEVSDAEAARLIGMGVAKAVEKTILSKPTKAKDDEPVEKNEESSRESEDYEDDEDETPEYSEMSSNAELQAIAKEYGIPVSNRANKSELLSALDKYFGSAPKLRS